MQSSLVREPTKLAIGSSAARAAAPDALRSRWSPKARRWYQRLLSGVTHHQAQGHQLRVITLTSGPDAPPQEQLNASWLALRKRVDRKFGKMEYWKLRTSEGLGVLHIIYWGTFIPQSWLSRTWQVIHASPVVYIQKLRFKRKKLINYLMSHYLPAHDHGRIYTRMSWSWGWVFRGFAGAWRWFWKQGPTMYDAIYDWNKLMRRKDPEYYYKMKRNKLYEQTVLKKRGVMGTVVFSQVA